ncbi:MAG: TonB-dependent receptor, partial [Bryobacteraceae bacterium]
SSFVYNIPVGRGMKYGSTMNKVADAFIGGWQVNGIATFQVGFPMTITGNDDGGLNDTFGTNRADIVGDIHGSVNRSIAQWFNTAAFKQPAIGYLGNSGRSILNAPGINNWDTGLFKNFKITERANVQFRFESFNSWNHTQWGVPDRNVASPNFGRVQDARAARVNQGGLKFLF